MTSKPHRLSRCHRHPTKPVTGFCASCLRERLAGIDSSATAYENPAGEPQLRRTKSCSGSGELPSATANDPRRRSCEVRGGNTLSDLFVLDDEKKGLKKKFDVDLERVGYEIRGEEDGNANEDAIRVCGGAGFDRNIGDVDDGRDEEVEEEAKTMKEFIDLELQSRRNAGIDFKDIAGSFWGAASTFSKKLRKWRRKQKLKKQEGESQSCDNGCGGLIRLKVEKPSARRLRETQSEVGEYGLSRRSCDTDPRLSIDAGRMSLEESRVSFDGPRASWDGYLIGKGYPRLSPMVSVREDAGVAGNGIENRVIVEKANLESEGELNPGGSAQTKDYYADSLSGQRRRSFDRSNSHRKSVIPEIDELKMISNAKVSPATSELFYGAKLLITEKDLRNGGLKSPKNIQSDCVLESASKDASDVATGVNQKGAMKFQKWRKVWDRLGLVQRRSKGGDEEFAAGEVLNKPLADPWQKLRRPVNGQAGESVSQKLIRSYSVSCRNPYRMTGLVNSLGGPETKGNVSNGRQDSMLQRNRSARYSPNNLDTGLLRFYLTPLKSYRRSKSGKSNLKDLHPTARNVL